VEHTGDRRGASRVLEDKPEGKDPLGRPRHRWNDSIKMGCEIGLGVPAVD